MIVCLCKAVSESQIDQAIDDGLDTFSKLQNSLSVAKQCGACSCEVKSILKHRAKQRSKEANSALLRSSLIDTPVEMTSTKL